MVSYPIGRLSGWRGSPGWPVVRVSQLSGWPVGTRPFRCFRGGHPHWSFQPRILPNAVCNVPISHRNFRDDTHCNISVFDTYFPGKLPRWYSLEHFYFWKAKRVLRRGKKRLNDILNNNISVFRTYFPAKLPRWYSLEHFYFRKWKRVLRRDGWYAVEHLCSWFLFSTETSEMIPTGTFLFLKMKPGSKKRQKTPTRYSKQQILRRFREKNYSNLGRKIVYP